MDAVVIRMFIPDIHIVLNLYSLYSRVESNKSQLLLKDGLLLTNSLICVFSLHMTGYFTFSY